MPQFLKQDLIYGRKGNCMDGIIFDVDGTLWDSTEIVAKAWTDYLRETEHIDFMITSEKLKGLFGRLLSDIAAELFPGHSASEQLRIIDGCCQAEHAALLKRCAPLYPELENTLSRLSEKYPLFIVSNCQAGYIEVFLTATGFGHYFKDHLCPGDTGEAKAGNIRKIVEKYRLRAPVYVGDTLGDCLSCKEAQVPFIFASYGFGQVPAGDCYAILQSPADLPDTL